MSNLILSGRCSDRPYFIENINLNIYSIEELCWILYHHALLIDTDFFGASLLEYLEEELGLSALAAKIERLRQRKATINELIILILEETEYYTKEELKNFARYLSGVGTGGRHEKLKARADFLFRHGKFHSALTEYGKILKMEYEPGVPVRFYAGIYADIGIINARLFLYKIAEENFCLAYGLYPEGKYLKYLVTAAILQGDKEELQDIIRKYRIADEILFNCQRDLIHWSEDAVKQERYSRMEKLLNNKTKIDRSIYYDNIHDIIDGWKKEYRQLLV